MQLRIPEIRVGRAITRHRVVVYPLHLAQRLLIPDDLRGVDCLLGSAARRKGWVKITPVREVGGFTEIIVNQSDEIVMFLPGDRLVTGRAINASVLVGPQTEVRIPSLCCVPVSGNPAPLGRPVNDSIGAVVVTHGCHYLHLFGNPNVCAKAWGRLSPAEATNGLQLGRAGIGSLVRSVVGLTWQRVRAMGEGSEFAASEAGIRGNALYVGCQLVYLRVLFSEQLP